MHYHGVLHQTQFSKEEHHVLHLLVTRCNLQNAYKEHSVAISITLTPTSCCSLLRTRPDPTVGAVPGSNQGAGVCGRRLEAASLSENDTIIENDDGKEQPSDETTKEFPKCKLGKEFPGRGRSNEAPSNMQTSDGSTELFTPSVAQTSDGSTELFTPSVAQTSDGSTELFTPSVARESLDQVTATSLDTAPQMARHIFTPSRINRAIAATDKIRILCAVTIALLVVISDHGYSLGGNIVRSLINFRPLFLVLLTDAAILLGWLFVVVGINGKAEDKARKTDQEEKGLADNVGMALEAGLVIQKALRAVVMDCSICAVIMISGL